MKKIHQNFKLGVLGGGQLGRMLIQPGANFNVHIKVLDPDPHAPCARLATEFVQGSLTDFDTVVKFGEDVDVLTIEIENVNTDALDELVKRGVEVYPQPHIIKLIQDKRTQKQFYKDHQIPTSDFVLVDNLEEAKQYTEMLPAVQKLGKEGYDGRGVQVINSEQDFEKGFDASSVLEKRVDIDKEISIIIARNPSGEIKTFPAVELVYHEQNLVDYLISPAHLSQGIEERAKEIATDLVEKLGFTGLLAVEMFVDQSGKILVNEVAPRPHNSGHQTIEGNYTSQYEQLLRAVLDLPLGDTRLRGRSAMVNVLGAEGYEGSAYYEGFDKVMALPGTYIHLYGKKLTKPFRKMGHVTILDDQEDKLIEKVELVKKHLKVITKD
ncbi:5-(carboxyamino)imidazole ribonucleotide synthase [Rapidithrix thailandica]|uniref:N5-carboxyaminoimidazole ribonucleotide synthase n=1 Tax=Rapidithrix thailandica TaxID=413964 RepID=A0AAW9SDE7_9BACT